MKSLDWGGTLSGSATALLSPLAEDPMPCFFLHHFLFKAQQAEDFEFEAVL